MIKVRRSRRGWCDHGVEPFWIAPFTGLSPRQFTKIVTALRREGADPVSRGRPWGLSLEDRFLLVAAYWRTNLTLRQLAPSFGVSKSAADRIIAHLGPLLALRPRTRFRKDAVLIVDGTLIPTGTTRSPSSRRTTGTPPTTKSSSMPTPVWSSPSAGRSRGNRNDCKAWELSGAKDAIGRTTVIADGGYRGAGLIIPHRRDPGRAELPSWKEEHNASHRKVRARVEHAFARMKSWKILRDCRLKGNGVHHAMLGIVRLHNVTITG
ncbi:transposase family protein [Streptomyces cellulosae]